jgi:hypothetical protein
MQKLVFAVQMIVLIAFIPVYILAEINHGNVKSPVNYPASANGENSGKCIIQPEPVDMTGQLTFIIFN